MEMKELLIRVIEKMNCKEMLKKYKVCLFQNKWEASDTYEFSYVKPCPTKHNPDNVENRNIRFVCKENMYGFSGSPYSFEICYPCTENETVELKYIFHQIKAKLEEIRRDELLELL